MELLLDTLHRHLPHRLGAVLHIGAGAHALELYAEIDVRDLILVEGDPDTWEELESAARSAKHPVQVLQQVVTPSDGPGLWHRYSVRALNGPLAADAASTAYPRLTLWNTLPCQGVDILQVLRRSVPEDDDDRPNVLVLDTPGQLDALLTRAGVGLRRFDWVICAGYAIELSGGLLAAPFASVQAARTEGLWAVEAWQFDRRLAEIRELRVNLDAATVRASEALHEREAMADELAQLRSQLQQSAKAMERQSAELLAGCDRQVEAVAGERDELREQRDRLESKLQEAAAALAQVQTARRQAEERAEVHVERLTAMERAQDEMRATAEDLAREQAARLEAEERARHQSERLTAVEREVLELRRLTQAGDQERDRLAAELATLRAEREAALADAEAARAAVKQTEQHARVRTGELEDEIGQLRLRQRLLDEEMIKTEGQIELIKDVLLREPSL